MERMAGDIPEHERRIAAGLLSPFGNKATDLVCAIKAATGKNPLYLFCSECVRFLWVAASTLHDQSGAVDAVEVYTWLCSHHVDTVREMANLKHVNVRPVVVKQESAAANMPDGWLELLQGAGSFGTAEAQARALVEVAGRRYMRRRVDEWLSTPDLTLAQQLDGIQADAEACRLKAAPQSKSAVDGMLARLQELRDGRRTLLSWPWPSLARLAPLLAGTVHVLVGAEGSGKSLMISQAVLAWLRAGKKMSVAWLEKDMEFYTTRALAQTLRDSRFADEHWQIEHLDECEKAANNARELLGQLELAVTIAGDEWDCDSVVRWVDAQAKAGSRVIMVDPIGAISEDMRRAADDHKRMVRGLEECVRGKDATVILTTHPIKGHIGPGLDGVHGGKAMTRFVDFVYWLERKPDHTPFELMTCGGVADGTCNRFLHMLKTRSGKGDGLTNALTLNRDELLFYEEGIVMETQKLRKGKKQ